MLHFDIYVIQLFGGYYEFGNVADLWFCLHTLATLKPLVSLCDVYLRIECLCMCAEVKVMIGSV